MYTQLLTRTLWYDGDSSYDESKVTQLINQFKISWVNNLTDEITQYNRRMPVTDRIKQKTELSPISTDWVLPVSSITREDILDFVMYNHGIITKNMSEDETIAREIRLAKELTIFYNTPNMLDMLKSIIYVVNTLTKNNEIWGVGRGSSVSSYILYVVGAHDVDSFMYDLDIADFISS